jgi:hypothetical protein
LKILNGTGCHDFVKVVCYCQCGTSNGPVRNRNSILTTKYPLNRNTIIKPSRRFTNSNGLLLQGLQIESHIFVLREKPGDELICIPPVPGKKEECER